MRAFLLGASLAAMLAGCSGKQIDVQVRPTDGTQVHADSGSFAKAQIMLVRGEYALAVDAYRKAIRYAPDNAAAYNGLAVAYDELGRHDLSRRNFELALAHAPGEAKYYRNFARSLERQGLGNEAQRVLADMRAAEGGLATAAPTPKPSLRSLAEMASEKANALVEAASAPIRPFLERLSLGEVILSTGEGNGPVTAGRSITVPIPTASAKPVREAVVRSLGRSITVEIPPPVPVAVEEARAESAQAANIPEPVRVEPLGRGLRRPLGTGQGRDTLSPSQRPLTTSTSSGLASLSTNGGESTRVKAALATLDSGPGSLQPSGGEAILLATAAVEPAELLALALRPEAGASNSCSTPGRPAWIKEHDLAIQGGSMRVFTGDFAPMRLGATGGAIELPLFYRASANLPISSGVADAGCSVRTADAPPAVDTLFSSLWLAWRDFG